MENANKAIFLGFSVILFVAAAATTIYMYEYVSAFREAVGQHSCYRNIWQVSR